MTENPFDYGKELLPEMTFNRLTEIQEVVETILHAGRLFLIGPRRHGKTTILALAAREAELHQSLDFARLKPAAMRSALRILEDRGIIRSEGAKGETLWVFDDPFFSGWIIHVRGKF